MKPLPSSCQIWRCPEGADMNITPKTAHLLSSKRPSRKRTNKERDAQLNRDRVNKHYRRRTSNKANYRIDISGEVIDMLEHSGWLAKFKTIERATEAMLADTARKFFEELRR